MNAPTWNGELYAVYGRYALRIRPCGDGFRWSVAIHMTNTTLHRENGCRDVREAAERAKAWADSQEAKP